MDSPNPVDILKDRYWPESYWPEDYIPGATLLLHDLELLAREITATDRATATAVLDRLRETGLDLTEVSPIGVVWALRSTGAILADPDLDAMLLSWREETGLHESLMPFLPGLD